MKVKYNGTTDNDLTKESMYCAFEVYARIDTGVILIRLIDNFGRPILMESEKFLYEPMSMNDLDVFIYDDMIIATLPDIKGLAKEKGNITDLWELYFNNEPSVVERMGDIISQYADESKIVIHKPFPYKIVK